MQRMYGESTCSSMRDICFSVQRRVKRRRRRQNAVEGDLLAPGSLIGYERCVMVLRRLVWGGEENMCS